MYKTKCFKRGIGGSGGEDAGSALRRARFLRIKITSVATGETRLETRLPAAFIDGIATVVPQVTQCTAVQITHISEQNVMCIPQNGTGGAGPFI